MNSKQELQAQILIAEKRLALYRDAKEAILHCQSYEMENINNVQSMIASLEAKISALKAKLRGRAKFRVVRPGW